MNANERERRVLTVLGCIFLAGALVRAIGARWPGATSGLVPTGALPVEAIAPVTDRSGDPARFDSLFVGERLDLNRAGEEHLVLLPGVGPRLASRVVELRRSRGGFARVEELLDVRGIGPRTLERLRPLVTTSR